MYSAKPFHSLSPTKFFKQRFSPLAPVFVEPEADELINSSAISFYELFAALGAAEEKPFRLVQFDSIKQTTQESFLSQVNTETMQYSQSFINPEFETDDKVDPKLSPRPFTLGPHLHYPSTESMNPPWYRMMTYRLLESSLYTDYDFVDLPLCIIYVSCSTVSRFTTDSLRNKLNTPQWMKEFITVIPIMHIVLYDGLKHSKPPDEIKKIRSPFDALFFLGINTREPDQPGAIEAVKLRTWFRYDLEMLERPGFCSYLSNTDITNIKKVLITIFDFTTANIDRQINGHNFEIDNGKKLKNKMKKLFDKKDVRVTKYGSVPYRKVIRLKVGSFYLITHRYVEARKTYKDFVKVLHEGTFPQLKLYANSMAALCCIMIPEKLQFFNRNMNRSISSNWVSKNARFTIIFPVLASEFHFDKSESSEAFQILKLAIGRMSSSFPVKEPFRSLFTALLYERAAGITSNQRKSEFYTANAGIFYLKSDQISHALRCCVWLLHVIQPDPWPLIYQKIWLEKASRLCQLHQSMRAITDCKDLLSLKNLDRSLHMEVINQLWEPFNNSSIGKKKEELQLRIESLLEIRSFTLIDKTFAEYWGFEREEFDQIIKKFEDWAARKHYFSIDRSIDSWVEDASEAQAKNVKPKIVPIGSEIVLKLQLYNRYRFNCNLDRAVLRADYEGQQEGEPYNIDTVRRIDIIGNTIKTTPIMFKFVPLLEGKFTVNRFEKNYWGYIDNEIDVGPLSFIAVKQYPRLKMEIRGLPDHAHSWDCVNFNINVINDGETEVPGFTIVFDNSNLIFADCPTEKEHDVSLLTIDKKLAPGESYNQLLHFRANQESIVVLHSFVAINDLRCAFAQHTVAIHRTATVRCIAVEKEDDLNIAIHCTIFSRIDGLTVIGIMNKDCKLLQTIKSTTSNVLRVGDSYSIVAFSNEETDTSNEEWRSKLLKAKNYAVLLKYPNSDIYAQKNLKCNTSRSSNYDFNVEIPSQIYTNLGESSECIVKLQNPQNDDVKIYIQPKTIQLQESIEYNRVGIISSCRWVGVNRILLSKDNNFTAKFKFTPFQYGIYRFEGFYISSSRYFQKKEDVQLSYELIISPKQQ